MRCAARAVSEEEITRVNGARIDSFYLAPKWLWVKEHEPEVYRRTAAVLQSNGYIACASPARGAWTCPTGR